MSKRAKKPRTTDERFARVAEMIVAMHKHFGQLGPEAIRLDVHKSLEQALDCQGPFLGPEVEIDGAMQATVSASGMFRMVINNADINYHDSRVRDHISAIVDHAVKAALNDPACGGPLRREKL